MNVHRHIAVALFRAAARQRRFRGATRLAYLLYDPFHRDDDYESRVVPYHEGLIQIDTRSFIEWWIYMFGSFEGNAVALLGSATPPHGVVFDVGANVGAFTLPLARCAAAIHAFEPHPRVRSRLAENVALNNLKNVTISDLALSDEDGEATLFGSRHANQGQASLAERHDQAERFVCPQRTLDSYVVTGSIDRVDAIKIDVEGAELKVLRGAEQTLSRFRPVLYLEVNPEFLAQFGDSPKKVGEFLSDLGYRVWRNDVVERRRFGSKCRLSPLNGDWNTGSGDSYWYAASPQE